MTFPGIRVSGMIPIQQDHIHMNKSILLTLLLGFAVTPGVTRAETVAHWRFDGDGFPAGTSAPPNADSYKDSSGKGNTMRRADGPNPNEYSSDVPSPLVPSLGKTNELSLRFPVKGEWRDIFTTPVCEINTTDFKEMTLEGAFKCESAGTFGGILTKDGQPNPASPYPPLQIAFAREDADPKNLGEHLLVQWTDGANKDRMLRSIGPLAKNRWYAFAVVMTKDNASLFLQSEKDKPYTLEQSVPLEGGAMAQCMGTWVIGRGFWAGKLDNPFCGWIDEVRISNEALPKEKFLFTKP
jgi:Concanavalin A-like lectin/glucanases superfamily